MKKLKKLLALVTVCSILVASTGLFITSSVDDVNIASGGGVTTQHDPNPMGG